MKTNKLIFIDSDETLKNSNDQISARTKKAIKDNILNGNRIIICTGRPRYQAIEVKKDAMLDDIIISSNGAEIYDYKNEIVIADELINNDLAIELVKKAFAEDIRLVLTIGNNDYVTKKLRNSNQFLIDKTNYENDLTNKKIKQFLFVDDDVEKINYFKQKIINMPNMHIVDDMNENNNSFGNWFRAANINCSKGNALKKVANYLKVPIENTIAIGNDKNDISMFKEAGLSIAVSNAKDDIKDMVDYVIPSNDEEGVAIFLEELIKKI